jgi:hypothetical protein
MFEPGRDEDISTEDLAQEMSKTYLSFRAPLPFVQHHIVTGANLQTKAARAN